MNPEKTGGQMRGGEAFWRRAVLERISEILEEDQKHLKEYYKAQEQILEELKPDTASRFEKFMENHSALSAEENERVYLAGFADGLRLGQKVFDSQGNG